MLPHTHTMGSGLPDLVGERLACGNVKILSGFSGLVILLANVRSILVVSHFRGFDFRVAEPSWSPFPNAPVDDDDPIENLSAETLLASALETDQGLDADDDELIWEDLELGGVFRWRVCLFACGRGGRVIGWQFFWTLFRWCG